MKVISVHLLLLALSLPLLASSASTGVAQLTRHRASGGKQRKSQQQGRRAAYWWQTALDFFNTRDDGNSGDLPPPSAAKQESASIEVTGVDGAESDEMLPTRPDPPSQPSSPHSHAVLLRAGSNLRSAAPLRSPQEELAEAQAHGFMIGARLESEGTDSMRPMLGSRDAVATLDDFHGHPQQKYVEEYDELPDEVAPKVGQSRSSLVIKGTEATSKEDLRRVQAGDVDVNHLAVRPMKKPRRRFMHRPRPLAALHQHSQQRGSAVVDSLSQLPPGNSKMQAQCEAFATLLKAQNVGGDALVKAWSGTCMPAVHEGKATPKYSTMCSAVVGAVEPFSLNSLWTPTEVCKAVVRVFKESGLGATPLQGL